MLVSPRFRADRWATLTATTEGAGLFLRLWGHLGNLGYRANSFYSERPGISNKQALSALGDRASSCHPSGSELDDRFKFYVYSRQEGVWPAEVSGHDPEKENAQYTAYEPLSNITANYPPTLLLHGKRDKDVPYEQSVLMVEQLEDNNVRHELITDPTWGHMFDAEGLGEPAVGAAFDKVLAFLDGHLR